MELSPGLTLLVNATFTADLFQEPQCEEALGGLEIQDCRCILFPYSEAVATDFDTLNLASNSLRLVACPRIAVPPTDFVVVGKNCISYIPDALLLACR